MKKGKNKRIDIYHLVRHMDYASWGYPILLGVLKVWAESIGWTVRISVAKEKDIDLDTDADAVAFSVYTQTAPMAYRISRKLRERDKLVVFGGPHFRGPNYTEGMDHCDVMAHTICEEQWLNLLRDIEAGHIQPGGGDGQARLIMDAKHQFRYPDNFHETFKHMKIYHLASVPTAIGCPYDCDFCNPFMKGKYFPRDIDIISNEVAHTPRLRPLFFADASSALNKQHTIKLMKAIAPLKRDILMECTLNRLMDPELLDALALGGVKWLTVGLESFNLKLDKLGGGSARDNIHWLLDEAHERGMMVEGNFIVGLDSDGPEVFDNIYEFATRSSLDITIIDPLTPYPNTRLYDDMLARGRIIDHNWEHYDYHHVVYRPKHMTEVQLIDGFNQLYRALYSAKIVFKNVKNAVSLAGIGNQSFGVLIYNIWSMYESRRKGKALKENKNHVEMLLKNLGQTAAPSMIS
jgi:radical SAM superfamily enzyme YgiQ (UPF0313 family)